MGVRVDSIPVGLLPACLVWLLFILCCVLFLKVFCIWIWFRIFFFFGGCALLFLFCRCNQFLLYCLFAAFFCVVCFLCLWGVCGWSFCGLVVLGCCLSVVFFNGGGLGFSVSFIWFFSVFVFFWGLCIGVFFCLSVLIFFYRLLFFSCHGGWVIWCVFRFLLILEICL